jgi:hypothetical protein
VQPYDRTHLIPIEDRKRELIAARHAARARRLYGTVQDEKPVSGEPPFLPVYLSADEVIGLIAYDRTTALSDPAPGAAPIFERWKNHLTGGSTDERQYPLVRDLRLVLARVRWWQLRKRQREKAAECPIMPLPPIARGQLRWAIRQHGKTAVGTIALLRTDVRRLLAVQRAHEAAIERATAILCSEIAEEHIVAFGRPGIWRTRRFKGGIHEPIPSVFFANPNNTIIADGWATCGWDATAQDWADWKGPEWGDVRFKRDEALRLIQRLFEATTMQITSGYISPLFVTDDQRRTAELTDPLILIYEERISSSGQLFPLLERVIVAGQSLLIIAGDVEGDALEFLVVNKQRGGYKLAAVQAPGRAILEETASFTGGLVVNRRLGIYLRDFSTITDSMLGRAKRVLVERDKTTIFEGAGVRVRPTIVVPSAWPQQVHAVGQVPTNVPGLLSDRTGAPGRPTSRHLVEAEFGTSCGCR